MLCGRRVQQETQDKFLEGVAADPGVWHVEWLNHLCVFVRKVLVRSRGHLRVFWPRFPRQVAEEVSS